MVWLNHMASYRIIQYHVYDTRYDTNTTYIQFASGAKLGNPTKQSHLYSRRGGEHPFFDLVFAFDGLLFWKLNVSSDNTVDYYLFLFDMSLISRWANVKQ